MYFYHYDMLFYKYIWYKSVLSYMYHFFAGSLLYFQVFHCDFLIDENLFEHGILNFGAGHIFIDNCERTHLNLI